jgi:hypothetical protein
VKFTAFVLSVFLSVLALPNSWAATLSPVADGDQITYQSLAIPPGRELVFAPTERGASTYTLKTTSDSWQLLRPDGRLHASFVDKGGTLTFYRGKEIPPERQFVRFPPNTELKAGLSWEAPPITLPTTSMFVAAGYQECGTFDIHYQAKSEVGPSVSLLVNGVATTVENTVRVTYEAWLPTCRTTGLWKKTANIVWAPELNLIVRAEYVAFTTTRVVDSSNGWLVTALQTAPRWEASQKNASSFESSRRPEARVSQSTQ